MIVILLIIFIIGCFLIPIGMLGFTSNYGLYPFPNKKRGDKFLFLGGIGAFLVFLPIILLSIFN